MSIAVSASYSRDGRPMGVHLDADDATIYNAIYDLALHIGGLTWDSLVAAAADCEEAPTSRKAEAGARFDQILDDLRREEGEQCLASVGHLTIPIHQAQAFAGDIVEAAGTYREAPARPRLGLIPGGAA